ncbi:MAG: NAD(P)/FAD-dependent oxidoreductase [Erysipelotrichaceae bacterium]|nr:NAD(P)/FAD-dependent oxidoreductase [Erysipelotrichaceae bacterium]
MACKSKLIIVGGGISGLAAGIYCLENGFDVEIYEKAAVAGGECMGWTRKGTLIDGCAHWIIGSNPKSDLYPSWRHIGVFPAGHTIYPTTALSAFDVGDRRITLYGDLNRLEKELSSAFPEDKKPIHQLIKAIRSYQKVRIPIDKPLDKMNLFELTKFGLPMLPMVFAYLKYSKVSMDEYAQRFSSPELRDILLRAMRNNYNAHAFFYVMQALSKEDAAVPEGGSLAIAKRVTDKYLSLGGKLYLNAEVVGVDYEKRQAKSIRLKNGKIIPCDYLLLACDVNFAAEHLFPEQEKNNYFAKRKHDPITYPGQIGFTLSYRTKADVSDLPKQLDFACEKKDFVGLNLWHIPLRNHSFDPTFHDKDGNSLLTVLIPANEDAYEGWKALSREEYVSLKGALLDYVGKAIADKLGVDASMIEPLDCATPITYERYCNAYKGSYMSFLSTKKNPHLMVKGTLRTIDNTFLTGQWLMLPGGMPIALFTAKNAAYRLSKKAFGRFLDLDEKN